MKPYASYSDNPSFSQTLFYEKRPDGTRGCLNGLVSGQIFSMTEADISGEPVLSGQERSLSGLWNYRYSGARLTEASYTELSRCSGVQLSAGDMEVFDSPDYSEVYTYSPSGNLLTLKRKGFTGTVYGSGTLPHSTVRIHRFNLVDDLTLSYDGPMLRKVSDYAADPAVSGATDFFDGIDQNTEYTYDLNGNMTSDLNKGITSITYNHLNLPVEVVYAGNNAVRYSYDASGRRLSVEHGIISWVIDGGGMEPVDPGIGGGDILIPTSSGNTAASQAPERVKRVKTFLVTSRRDYCGSYLYADGELERILTESGWYNADGSYTATVNDHQGNLRSTLTKSYASSGSLGGSGTAGSGDLVGDLGGAGTIGSGDFIGIGGGGTVEPQKPRVRYENLTAYSPYGLPLTDWQGDERYLYSGKELDRTGGLMLYDFHARQYDPQLGRFTSQDPMQGKYPSLNSHLYCAANPISLTDPTGMDVFELNKMGYISLNYSTSDIVDILQSASDASNFIVMDKSIMASHGFDYINTTSTAYGTSSGVRIDYYEGDKGIQPVYDFVIANSDVEWSKVDVISNSENRKTSSYIGTIHHTGSDSSQSYFLDKAKKSDQTITKAVHNHSEGNTVASDGDIEVTKLITKDFPQANCFIVFPNNSDPPQWIDPNGKGNMLNEFIVTPNN